MKRKLCPSTCNQKYNGKNGRDEKRTDGGGLYLNVRANGYKSWRYNYKIKLLDGSRENHTFTIGAYPQISLKEARDLHEEAHKLVSQGIHPKEYRDNEERRKRKERSVTFEDITKEWMALRKEQVNAKTYYDTEKRLQRFVLPEIGKIPMKDLNKADLRKMLKKIEDRGTYGTCKRVGATAS